MTSANQTPGGYKFAPLVASQQGRANQHEPACFGVSSPWSFPSRSGIRLRVIVQPWLSLQRPILRHSPSSWAAVIHWSALMPKALRWSRKYLIHSFSWLPTQPAPPTSSPNITYFAVPSKRATNPANKIRLLCKVASVLSLPVLISLSR